MPGVWYAEAAAEEEDEEGSSTERTASARMPSCRRRSMTSRCCARMRALISLLSLLLSGKAIENFAGVDVVGKVAQAAAIFGG